MMKWLKFSFAELAICLLIGKAVVSRLTPWDCVGALLIIAYYPSVVLASYFFPKRPDVYKDVELIQKTLVDIQNQMDRTQADVTALRLQSSRVK